MSRNYAGLSHERIITEALHIIAGRGLGGLSMRRLGDALQVEAMAVYHHFPLGKEQLFDAIAAHITDPPDARGGTGDAGESEDAGDEDGQAAREEGQDGEEPERPWDERLTGWAHQYRDRLLEYSGALSLLVHRSPRTRGRARVRRLQHRALAEAGLRGEAVGHAAAALDSYVLGSVVHEVREKAAAPDAEEEAVDPRARFEAGLRALLAGLTAPGGR